MHLLKTLALTALPFLSVALRSSGNAPAEDLLAPTMSTMNVAIIGAGAGGASTAYHLAQLAKEEGISINITVFERESYIGGRSTTVNAWDDPYVPIELGASIFVEVNHILNNASKEFGLEIKDHDEDTMLNDSTPDLGVWDGQRFVVITAEEDGWWEKAKLLWRYGLAPIKTNRLMKSTVGKFLKMYDEPIFPWKSLSDAAEEVGLREATGVTGEQFLRANGIGEAFSNEIIQASTRVNYAQNLPLIHGLETMVCMAAEGAMAIKGGNWRIFSAMLKRSGADIRLNTTVNEISKQGDGTYILTADAGVKSSAQSFDSIILAAPYQFSAIDINPSPRSTPDEIPYVELHVTLFASPHRLDPAAFNLKPDDKVPQFVITTLPPGEQHGSDPDGVGSPGFFSISVVGRGLNPNSSPTNRPEYIYKIFSAKPVDSRFLTRVLGHKVPDDEVDPSGAVTWIIHKIWHPYPYEYPRVTFEDTKLDDNLWYTSGIESFISTMETSALSGKNVAKLIIDEWIKGNSKTARLPKTGEAGEKMGVQEQPEWEFAGLKDEEQKPIKAKL
ncbi:prenylcysteine oxidase-like protein 1 precursor [Lophiotrema nucula]|uniref:Prenylcysteine oxidase-like protein 1 n=1 Tax=Lophiotrema nucula TaxID=690887 RepID=A0A6A5ZU84_9PLEO|nr:prenylcysteine oxidase-like protein 1 precursor [Lophiotrema nucula]